MEIKKLQHNDLLACSKLLESAYGFPPYNEIFKENTAKSYIDSKYSICKDTCFVALDEKKNIIAFIFFHLSHWNKGLQAILEELVVDPNYQNKGVGRELLKYTHDYLKSLDVKCIMLWAKNNEQLLDFYKKEGYAPTNDFVVMFKNF
jgi:GNAT superfamily N-acetyltransferase